MSEPLSPAELYAKLQDPHFLAGTFRHPQTGLPYVLNTLQTEILASDARFLHIRTCRRGGLTLALAFRALFRALFRERQEILYVSPTRSGAEEFQKRLVELLHHSPYLPFVERVHTTAAVRIGFRSGSVIRMVSVPDERRARLGLCGIGADEVLVDDAPYLPENAWDALRPILVGDRYRAQPPRGVIAGTGLVYDPEQPPFLVRLTEDPRSARHWQFRQLDLYSIHPNDPHFAHAVREFCPSEEEWRTQFLAEYVAA